MKRMKRIVSVLLAMVMVLGMSVTAFADGDKSITIKSSPTVDVTADGKVFTAYKILDAEATGANNGVVYTVPDGMEEFYNTRYFSGEGVTVPTSNYAYQVAQKISAEPDLYAFAEAALEYIHNKNITGKTGSVAGKDYVISGLEVGYYLIEDNTTGDAASQVMLDTTITNLDITVKADLPTIDKKIDGAKDTDPATPGFTDKNNASVGDVVPYVLTSKVPAMSGYKFYRFVMSDTLSEGLTLNVAQKGEEGNKTDDLNGSFTVKIGGTELPSVEKDKAKEATEPAYYVNKPDTTDGTTAIEIVFVNFVKLAPEHVGEDITVEYSATLNHKAEIGTLGNPNTASLEYSNNPSYEGNGFPDRDNPYEFNPDDPDEPSGETEDITVKTFVTALELVKVNSAGQTLAGAQFTIEGERLNEVFVNGMQFVVDPDGNYWGYNGTYTTQDPQKYLDEREKYSKELEELTNKPEADRPTNYDEAVAGLEESIQKLDDIINRYETNPETSGFVQYAKKVVGPTGNADEEGWKPSTETEEGSKTYITETLTVDNNGELVFRGLAAGTYTITEIKAPDGYNLLTAPIRVTITCDYKVDSNKEVSADWEATYTQGDNAAENITFDGEQGMFIELKIENSTGALLPSTGGIGTTIFYVAGSILVLAAVVLLVTKKRMSREK